MLGDPETPGDDQMEQPAEFADWPIVKFLAGRLPFGPKNKDDSLQRVSDYLRQATTIENEY